MASDKTSPKASFFLKISIVVALISLPIVGFYLGTKYRALKLKIYTDSFYDYSFKYPSDWFIDKNDCSAGEIKIGNDKEYVISVRIHPRGDNEYIDKIWKKSNCVTCDYDLAPIPYTDTKRLTLGGNTFYWNKDGSGAVHGFVVTPLKDKTIEFSTFGPNKEPELQRILSSFEFIK